MKSPKAPSLIKEPLTVAPAQPDRTAAELNNLLSGREYDASVLDCNDPVKRQVISAQLLAALAGRNSDEQDRAKRAFLAHGYANDAIAELRSADSPAERAAAARKLGVVRDGSAAAQLIAALNDSAPEVRRAAAESLGQIGDPAAIAPPQRTAPP